MWGTFVFDRLDFVSLIMGMSASAHFTAGDVERTSRRDAKHYELIEGKLRGLGTADDWRRSV